MMLILYMHRLREQYGTERVSTAYQFYLAVKKHLVLDESAYNQDKEKPIFAATSYKLYYVAADEADARDKDDVFLTLDRTKMWDCNVVNGSSRCYEFIGQPVGADGKLRITKRFLPCPCSQCRDASYENCLNNDVVTTTTTNVIKVREAEGCPDNLDVPLNQYTNGMLKAFIKLYHVNNKCPVELSTKPLLINYIMVNFSDHVSLAVEHNNNN